MVWGCVQATSTPTPASSPFFPSSSASRQTAPAFVTTCQPGLKRSSSLHHKCGLKTSHEQIATGNLHTRSMFAHSVHLSPHTDGVTAGQRRALPVLRAALEASSSSSMAQQGSCLRACFAMSAADMAHGASDCFQTLDSCLLLRQSSKRQSFPSEEQDQRSSPPPPLPPPPLSLALLPFPPLPPSPFLFFPLLSLSPSHPMDCDCVFLN